MFQRGSSPIRLSQLDVTPMVQAAQTLESANVNLNNAINQSILSFAQKQEQKKQDKIGIQAIQNMFGLDETTAKAMYKDDVVRDAFVMKQKADADLVRKQREQVELEILAQGMQELEDQKRIAEQAIAANRTPEGTVDMSGVKEAFIELGGRDLTVFGGLLDVPGEIKITDKGVISQDGKFMGQLPQSALPPKPKTEDELKESRLRLEILETERDLLLKELSGGVTGTIDTSLLSDADLEAYNEAIKNPTSEDAQEFFRLILQQQQANQ